jgi:nucleotide-binding universal stress UspA family protein
MIKFKKILFPTSLTSSESHALDYAISLVLQHEAALCLVYVVEDGDFNSSYILSYFPRVLELKSRHVNGEGQARKRLHEVVSPQLSRQIAVEEVLAKGKPYEEILRIAWEKDVDLIVIASHRAP